MRTLVAESTGGRLESCTSRDAICCQCQCRRARVPSAFRCAPFKWRVSSKQTQETTFLVLI